MFYLINTIFPRALQARAYIAVSPQIHRKSFSNKLFLSCTVSEIYRDIGRKSPISTYPTSTWRPHCWWPR